MRSFFFNLIGVDQYILNITKNDKQTGFILAGITIALLFLFSFFSSYYLMTYLIKNPWLDVLIAVLFSSILFNFYRFTISSIIWRSGDPEDPSNVRPPDFSSVIIKVLSCSFFVLLISKPIELLIFHNEILRWQQMGQTTGITLYGNFFILHQHFPATWIITAIFLIFFLWPLLYRSYSSKWGNKEYESKHYETLICIIRQEFEWFENHYNEIFTNKGLEIAFSFEERYYDLQHKKYSRIRWSAYRTQYADPPFNSLLKDKVVNTKGTALKEDTGRALFDFLDQLPIHKEDPEKP